MYYLFLKDSLLLFKAFLFFFKKLKCELNEIGSYIKPPLSNSFVYLLPAYHSISLMIFFNNPLHPVRAACTCMGMSHMEYGKPIINKEWLSSLPTFKSSLVWGSARRSPTPFIFGFQLTCSPSGFVKVTTVAIRFDCDCYFMSRRQHSEYAFSVFSSHTLFCLFFPDIPFRAEHWVSNAQNFDQLSISPLISIYFIIKFIFSLQQQIPLQKDTTDQNAGNNWLIGDQLQLMQLQHTLAPKEDH